MVNGDVTTNGRPLKMIPATYYFIVKIFVAIFFNSTNFNQLAIVILTKMGKPNIAIIGVFYTISLQKQVNNRTSHSAVHRTSLHHQPNSLQAHAQ